MIADYPQASVPEPVQVLGLELKPFCLGHALHLERFGSAFGNAATAIVPELGDLVLAVIICAHSYEGFLEFIRADDWRQQIAEWARACGPFDVAEKSRLLQAYILTASQQPAVVFESEGQPSGAHWIQSVKVTLIELGYTPGEAMNLPLAQAFHDFYKSAENAGVLKICDRETAEMIERLESLDAAPLVVQPSGCPEVLHG